jgi:hypothetical protein
MQNPWYYLINSLPGARVHCMSVSELPTAPQNGQALEPIATRQSLLERLKDWGDQTSWQDFFDTYWRLIYNVALKAGLTDAEAQEVVQETVIAVAKKIPGFQTDPDRGSFRAWLMRLTRWRITDQFRKRRRPFAPNPAAPASPGGADSTGSPIPSNACLIPPATRWSGSGTRNGKKT